MISYFIDLPDGIRLHYETAGARNQPPLILLHGLTGSCEGYTAIINELQQHYWCIAPDLPGHGQSSGGDLPYSIPFYEKVLLQFLDTLQIKRFQLCGHSMGGQLAIAYTYHHPERVKRLVLLAPAGFETFTPAEVKLLIGLSAMPLSGRHAQYAHAREWLQQTGKMQVVIRSARGMLEYPVWNMLPELDLPTLVVFGSKDRLIPNPAVHARMTSKQIALRGARQLPQASVRLIRDEGHFLHRSSGRLIAELILKHEGRDT